MLARAIESVLSNGGYRVTITADRQQTLTVARRQRPDGIIVDVSLAEPPDYEICRALRGDAAVSLATPILMTTVGHVTRAQHIDALRAGAWELCGHPLDAEFLLLRMGAYVQGKLEVDRLGAAGLLDTRSGLYNTAGIVKRADELAAFTAREGLALACAVFQPTQALANGVDADRVAVAFKHAGRISDAVGRTAPAEFAVFAPATDAAAASQLVSRLSLAVPRLVDQPGFALQAGYSATTATATSPVSPPELLGRARRALGIVPPPPRG
jgi:CheY-like chemotaxis protein